MMVASVSALAQSVTADNSPEFELRAGVNLGGAVPIPMPAEIRSIEGYKPGLNGIAEAVVTKWMSPTSHWGIMTGLRFEVKGMKAIATVKNYATSIENSGAVLNGRYTGKVFTDFSSTYLAFPVQMAFRFGNKGKINAGCYFSWRIDGDFSGHVTDGYFRQGSPLGDKIVFGADQQASYDFKDQISPIEAGAQIGGSWRAYKHFLVFADLKYSFSNIFKSGGYMEYINMHPLYFSLGFGYLF